ncbi:MAG TPA: magnesium chelatase domain-containing protein, partial [Thermoanaerobaculia bacterium]|nr:magnesium chelatase domain-containing protein [Thermoanaerobaculia bacterium]
MLAKVWSAATLGIDAVRIVIEVSEALAQQPGFTLVGLPDPAVREALARVRSALANCGFYLPQRHITVNLSPADVKKEGSGFDLPIGIGILHALEFLRAEDVAGRLFVGELSLDGALTPVRGALSISAAIAGDDSVRELVVPIANANEAAAVQTVRVIGARSIPTLLAHLRGTESIAPTISAPALEPEIDGADFADVRGQSQAKRALE